MERDDKMIMELKRGAGAPPSDIVEIEGGYWVPAGDSHVAQWQQDSGELCHDKFLPAFFTNKMREGDVVIDGGAFNGDHTQAYSNAVGVKGVVMAVEAGSLAYKCLIHNIGLFRYKNVMAIQAALSEESGKPVKHEVNENMGASTVKEVPKEEMMEGGTYILTMSIDYIAAQIQKKIDWIKLDVEGCEVKALIGAAKTLMKDKPGLMIEVNRGALEAQGDSVASIYSTLKYFGYEWNIIQENCTEESDQFDLYAWIEPSKIIVAGGLPALPLNP